MKDDRSRVLLALARASIASALGETCFADQSAPWLRDKAACFVTLKQNGELRGCVGDIEARRSNCRRRRLGANCCQRVADNHSGPARDDFGCQHLEALETVLTPDKFDCSGGCDSRCAGGGL